MMTKEQAFEICETAEAYFNFELSQQQLKLWIELLEEQGDYEETKKKMKNRATSDTTTFKPMLNEIIAKPYQQNINTDRQVKRMNKEQKRKLKKRIEEIDEKTSKGELTIYDL